MATYQRKRETVEAVQFTAKDGLDVIEYATKLAKLPANHGAPASPLRGLLARVRARETGGGFELGGEPIAFGDYVIGGPKGSVAGVMGREAFEAQYESTPQFTRELTPALMTSGQDAQRALGENRSRQGAGRRTPALSAPAASPTAPTDPAPAPKTEPKADA